MWGVQSDHEFKMRSILNKREMGLMGNSCGQFNEVTTIKNRTIVNSDRLVSGAYLQNFFKNLKN